MEVPGASEPCLPSGEYAPLSMTAYTSDNTAYIVEAQIEGGDGYLAPGEVVEVEIDIDDVMASLKANEHDALVLAAHLGVRSTNYRSKSGVTNAIPTDPAATVKLTGTEYEAVARLVYASVRVSGSRATGRSDPAPNSWTRRIEAVGQALGRAFQAIGHAFATAPTSMRVQQYSSDGARKYETVTQLEVRPN